jgi:hypothetical protein
MKSLLITSLMVLVASLGFSQNEEYPQNKITTYIFSIDKITNQQQLDNLESEIKTVKAVKNVKIICKWESGKGQLSFSIEEIITESENKENFDMSVIKQMILKQNLEFVDFKIK